MSRTELRSLEPGDLMIIDTASTRNCVLLLLCVRLNEDRIVHKWLNLNSKFFNQTFSVENSIFSATRFVIVKNHSR